MGRPAGVASRVSVATGTPSWLSMRPECPRAYGLSLLPVCRMSACDDAEKRRHNFEQ